MQSLLHKHDDIPVEHASVPGFSTYSPCVHVHSGPEQVWCNGSMLVELLYELKTLVTDFFEGTKLTDKLSIAGWLEGMEEGSEAVQ